MLLGGDPWMGATIGAIGYGTNLAMHRGNAPKKQYWDMDGDGKMRKMEADYHWLYGNGEQVNIDASKSDWSGLRIPDGLKLGDEFSIGTIRAFWDLPLETAGTYGGTSFRVISPNSVQILDQDYHYNLQPGKPGRNFGTIVGMPRMKGTHFNFSTKGQGTNFRIHYYNSLIIIK